MVYSPVAFKGCDHIIEAYFRAKKNIPELRLVCFGAEHPWRELPEGTIYTRQPAQDKIREQYAACDAWLFGSRTEGFGLPLLEAMACRTPLIATPAGAAPELIAEGGGVLVDMNDPSDMARQIERVVKLPDDQWRRMSDAACATAQNRTWEQNARLLERTLNQILAIDARRDNGAENRPAPPARGAAPHGDLSSSPDSENESEGLLPMASGFADGRGH
jgi:glycosyltransferase involved in cell wall biosynthesis